jgi:hypothetical protein
MIAAFVIVLLVATTPPSPSFFVSPKGWAAKDLPPDAPADFIWLSPRFGKNGNGDNFMVMSHHVSAETTLGAEVRRATTELSQDRTISDSHSEQTCRGRQPGWSFKARLALPNGKTVSQLYQITILNQRAYAFVLTQDAAEPVDRAIKDSIESICPA